LNGLLSTSTSIRFKGSFYNPFNMEWTY